METERRGNIPDGCPLLDPEEIDKIAERAADRAFDKIYQEVGRGVLTRLAWLVGAAVIALLMWMSKHGVELKL